MINESADGQHLWIDPGFGASGDMLLGSLVGLLGSADPLENLKLLDVDGYELSESTVIRAGLSCTRVEVQANQGPARHWSEIDQLLAKAQLPATVIEGARRTFLLLGEVEAAQHGVPIEEVHFHEVGAVDAIVDIVGTWLLIDAIAPASTTVGPVGLGHGTVEAAHGTLPLPAPATVALLTDCPIRGLDVVGETCTPTGAALLVTLADQWGVLPTGTIAGTSRGAGRWDPKSHPNALTVVSVGPSLASGLGDENCVILETNVDDVTPEVLAHTISQLLAAGADDAWVVPIVMKKGRPAHEVRVLCSAERATALRGVLLSETGSLGCRTVPVTKHTQERTWHEVEVRGHTVRIKVGPHGSKPEFDDLVTVANATSVPIRLLSAEALTEWQGQASNRV